MARVNKMHIEIEIQKAFNEVLKDEVKYCIDLLKGWLELYQLMDSSYIPAKKDLIKRTKEKVGGE